MTTVSHSTKITVALAITLGTLLVGLALFFGRHDQKVNDIDTRMTRMEINTDNRLTRIENKQDVLLEEFTKKEITKN